MPPAFATIRCSMALKEMHDYFFSECLFELNENAVASPSGRGLFINVTQTGDPAWQGTFVTGDLSFFDLAQWKAWKKSLRGGFVPFTAFDDRYPSPLMYPDTENPQDVFDGWDGTATVTSLGLSGLLSVSGLPEYYEAVPGDRVGLEQGDYRGYYEIVQGGTVGSAGTLQVSVLPFLHTTLFTTAAVARFWQPRCKFILNLDSWAEQDGGDPMFKKLSFQGWQML